MLSFRYVLAQQGGAQAEEFSMSQHHVVCVALASSVLSLLLQGAAAPQPRGEIIGDVKGLIKLVFDPESRTLLGVHIIGEGASELLHIGMMVMQFGGTINAFIDCVFNFPTVSEAYKYAAYDGLGTINRKRTVEEELI